MRTKNKMQYLFCDARLIYACNLAGYMFTVDPTLWEVWIDVPAESDTQPYALERFVLPAAFERFDDLAWEPIQAENGAHLHLNGFLPWRPGHKSFVPDPGQAADTADLPADIEDLPDPIQSLATPELWAQNFPVDYEFETPEPLDPDEHDTDPDGTGPVGLVW